MGYITVLKKNETATMFFLTKHSLVITGHKPLSYVTIINIQKMFIPTVQGRKIKKILIGTLKIT